MVDSPIFRGAVDIVERKEVEKLILEAREGRRPRVKLGIDPTADLIHLGHLVLIRKLKDFQQEGFEVCLIIGDFTARIGDPSGRSELRPRLSEEQIKRNSEKILEGVMKFLDPSSVRVYYNSTWLSTYNSQRLFEIFSLFTVSQILEREDFSQRLEKGVPLYVHEFLYPFLQALDSIHVSADIEIGGTDQLFNLLFARELMRRLGVKPQACLTLPLLEGTDGKRKMSKSYGNWISPFEKAEDIYGKLMGIPDELVEKYYTLLVGDPSSLKNLKPFDAKRKMAFDVVKEIKGEDEAKKAQEWFDKVIRKKEFPQDITKEYEIPEGTSLKDALALLKLVSSKSEAGRIILSGGVKVNDKKITDPKWRFEKGEYLVRVGKTKFAKIRVL